jgi:hypothetical protein
MYHRNKLSVFESHYSAVIEFSYNTTTISPIGTYLAAPFYANLVRTSVSAPVVNPDWLVVRVSQ